MRVICQQCSAAYSIDDKAVTAKGVRAQCPKCRHLQLVRADPPATPSNESLPAKAGSSGFFFDLGGTLPAPSSPARQGPPPVRPPAAAAPLPEAPSPFEFAAPAGRFDFEAVARGSASPPQVPEVAQVNPFGAPHLDLGADLLGLGSATPAQRAAVPEVKCRSCGKVMTDPFDQALGICDDCRNSGLDQANQPLVPPSPRPSTPRAAAQAAKISRSTEVLSATRPNTSESRDEEKSGSGKSKFITAGILSVVALGALGWLAFKRPWVPPAPPLAVQPLEAPQVPVETLIGEWKSKYPGLNGSSVKYIEEGEQLLTGDTANAFAQAEERFEQALVLDPSNDRAIAGWVLAIAFGRADAIDERTEKMIESMLSSAQARRGAAGVFVADAHFRLARQGNPNDIKVLAERGLNSQRPRDKALAALAIGATLLLKNAQMAGQSFKDALTFDPELKRTYLFKARLELIQGNYPEAIKALEHRLELDADQWEASEELARVLIDVGEMARAKKVLEGARDASPHSAHPRLALAMLSYQHLGDLKGAEENLTALLGQPLPSPEKAQVLLHLATIERIHGESAKALETIDRALALKPEFPAAGLQKLLILLDQGVTSAARLELEGLKGKLGDKYLESTLEGRMLIAEGRFADAIQTLSATAEADPRRVYTVFLAGAAAAKLRKDGKAWELCLRRGLRVDPNSRPVPTLTHFFVRPADLLKPAVGAYLALVNNQGEDPSPALCEGLVAWFSDDWARAERLFAKVTSIDARSPDGYAYRALAALRRKDVKDATSLANRGLDGGKSNALVYFAQAQALMQAGKIDLAKVAAQTSLKYGPQLLGAKVVIGAGEAHQKNPEEARRVLTSVLLSDPLYRDAKRVLYKYGL